MSNLKKDEKKKDVINFMGFLDCLRDFMQGYYHLDYKQYRNAKNKHEIDEMFGEFIFEDLYPTIMHNVPKIAQK